MKTAIEFIPYGEISTRLTSHRWRILSQSACISKSLERTRQSPRSVFISFSQDLDETFVEMFRKWATQDTRLLILNEGCSTDRLISLIVDLQIRTTQRFYVMEAKSGSGKTHYKAFVQSFLKRLKSALETDNKQERILDARIADGVLHLISPNFDRLDVPITKIPEFTKADSSKVQAFEIDEDGSFIYWPEFDLHLGWAQLQQLVNPEAALKASQKSQEFNKRYGRAVQKVREQAGLKPSGISGISEKQLRRIENGECRLTSNAIEVLSQAHKLAPNEYMTKLAEVLG
jgi:hypothetical protein